MALKLYPFRTPILFDQFSNIDTPCLAARGRQRFSPDQSERAVYRILGVRPGLLGSALFRHFGRVLQLVANFFGVHEGDSRFIHTQCDETLLMVVLTFVSR